MDISGRFLDYIAQQQLFHSKEKLLLAVSGGVDSVVLCDLCSRAGFDFSIVHCNFKLRGEDSERDERFVVNLGKKYNVEVQVKKFDTKKYAAEKKLSIEEAARELRYGWFGELMGDKQQATGISETPTPRPPLPAYLLTGHHADDTIETVMMYFFRGTGIKGMRGMLPKNGKVVRPLLFARRKEIEEYAKQNGLEYVTDQTNFEDNFTRNFFRNRVIPMVKEFFPAAEQNILNNAVRFADAEELYEQAIALHKKKLLEQKGNEVHIPALKLKKTSPLHSIVYEMIKDFGFTAHQTGEVTALLDSESGKYVTSSSHRIIKNRNWLIIAPLQTADSQTILIEPGDTEVVFAGGKLQLEVISNQQPATGNHIAFLDVKNIQFPLLLRKWKTGDYFYPLGMKKKKKLSRFFIDQKLSRTEKENIWVIESGKRITWVIGHRIDERFKIKDGTKEILQVKLIID